MEDTFDVIVAWDYEAALILDSKDGLSKLKKSKKFTIGGDWGIYKFKTSEEANAFVKGIDLANGWDSPHWTMANWENNKVQEG